jgi:Mitochondrial K+-H+ exchange-related
MSRSSRFPSSASFAVKVFLLPLDHTQSFFYSEDHVDASASPATRTGLRGWFERTAERLKSALKHPKSRLGRSTRTAWDWLQQRMHPDEALLATLRRAPTIEVYHRMSLTSGEVRDLWCAYLKRRFRRHLPWLLFDALLSPLSLLLAPLPGPNVIGYWFAYRAVRHLLILLGIRRAMSGRVETTFHPVTGLEAADGECLTRAARRYRLKRLHDFVKRIGPATATAGDARGETQRPCDC